MHRNLSTWLLLIGFVSVVAAADSQAPQKSTANTTNVTTVVYDHDAAGSPLLLRSDDYNGAGQATYGAALNTNVTSYIGPTGGWRLGLYSQSVRTLYITPNDAVNSAQPFGPPPGYYWQNVEVYSLCFDQNNNIVPLPNVVTASGNCSLGMDFYVLGTKYKMVMSPSLPAASCPASGCPITGLVTVACNALNASGQCVNWTIAPNPAAAPNNNPAAANLYKYAHNGSLVYVGQYYNTYRIGATNP